MHVRLLAPVVLSLVLCATTACSAEPPEPTSTPEPVSIRGSVDAPPFDVFGNGGSPSEGEDCTAAEGYDDIVREAEVDVVNAAGEVLAFDHLGPGTVHIPAGGAPVDAVCRFDFAISDVPSGRRSYGIHVGDEDRGTLQYTKKDLEAGVVLTIR